VFWLSVLLALVLTWKQGALTAAIERTARHVGEPGADSFRHTLRALGWTLLKAAPLPLLFAVTSGLLQGHTHGTALSHAVGAGLQAVALNLYVLLALRQISLPGGLAQVHLQWPEPAAHQLRVELGRLLWVFIPANVVGRLAMDLNPEHTGGVVARLALLLVTLAVAVFFYRVFHPTRGVVAHLRRQAQPGAALPPAAAMVPCPGRDALCDPRLDPERLRLLGGDHDAFPAPEPLAGLRSGPAAWARLALVDLAAPTRRLPDRQQRTQPANSQRTQP
jgi:small-conductance mechanosensitive channel